MDDFDKGKLSREFDLVCKIDRYAPFLYLPEQKIYHYLKENEDDVYKHAQQINGTKDNRGRFNAEKTLGFDEDIAGSLLNDPKYEELKKQMDLVAKNHEIFVEAVSANTSFVTYLQDNPDAWPGFSSDPSQFKFFKAAGKFMCDPATRESFLALITPYEDMQKTGELWSQLQAEGAQLQQERNAQKNLAAADPLEPAAPTPASLKP